MWSRLSSVLLKNIFCFALILEIGYAQWVVEDDGCRTPDRGVGNCIPLIQCGPMVNVLKSLQRPISQTVLKKLQAYTCGSDGGGVKVCCPPDPLIVHTSPTSKPPNGPIDISNHRNFYLLPKKCGYLDADNKIVNGEDAAMNEFPWMALLRYRGKRGLNFNCGGTIINKNYILTAAHCIKGISSELVSVRVGEHSVKNDTDCEIINRQTICNPPVQDLTIEEIIPHPKFGSNSFMHDIGLIRVSTINLDVVNARPVCLPLKQRTNFNQLVIVTGWGISNTETGQTSDILQKVGLPIAEKQSCAKTYQSHNIELGASQICAGGVQNKDSCPGDSGGPMLVATIDDSHNSKYVQEGIVSFGPKFCGITGYPGVYTLVSHFMDWILDSIRP